MGITDFVKGIFSSASDELPEIKALAKIGSLGRIGSLAIHFQTLKKAISAGICCKEAAEALEGVQVLNGEVQRMAEITRTKINDRLKSINNVGIIPHSKEYTIFQSVTSSPP